MYLSDIDMRASVSLLKSRWTRYVFRYRQLVVLLQNRRVSRNARKPTDTQTDNYTSINGMGRMGGDKICRRGRNRSKSQFMSTSGHETVFPGVEMK